MLALSAAVFVVSIVCVGAFVVHKSGFAGTLFVKARTDTARSAKNTTQPGRFSIESALLGKLSELEARPADIVSRYSPQDRSLAMQASIPRGKPFEWVVWQLSAAAEAASYRVSDCVVDERKSSCALQFAPASKRDPLVALVVTLADRYQSGTTTVALVVEGLDDTTYDVAVSIMSFPEPLSISVAPIGLRAPLIAGLAGQYKKEVVIRLPLEPVGKIPPEFQKSTIMVHYPEKTIRSLIGDAVRRIPNAAGFTNLWTSHGIEDSRLMDIVLSEIGRRRGYFIETKTTRTSVAGAVAQRCAVPYRMATAKLEKTSVPDLVSEIKRSALAAQTKGSLVIRCTGTRQLGEALKAVSPFLRQNGVRLVFVSDIVKNTAEKEQ